MTYGVPYMGSKNRIAKDIIDLLPSGNRLVDLFAGGCAITHCALLSGKWSRILNNDKLPLRGQTLFINAVNGEYNKPEYYRIVGYDEFYSERYLQPHVVAVWGFNYSPKYIGIGFERFCHGHGWSDLRQIEKGIPSQYHFPLAHLRRLQRLSGQLDLSNVEFAQMDYADYDYQEGDVVYCDPPYKNTDPGYGIKFDHERFWNWVRCQAHFGRCVYVSEYNATDDFVSIWEKRKATLVSPSDPRIGTKGIGTRLERLFIHSSFKEVQ